MYKQDNILVQSPLSSARFNQIYFHFVRNYINEEHKDKKKTPLDINEWSQLLAKARKLLQIFIFLRITAT